MLLAHSKQIQELAGIVTIIINIIIIMLLLLPNTVFHRARLILNRGILSIHNKS